MALSGSTDFEPNVAEFIEEASPSPNIYTVTVVFSGALFAAGLAYYISVKRAPEKTTLLKQLYEEEFDRAMSQDEDRASFRIRPFRSVV